ncbi:hypothetical protein SDC9_177622 [bioreactor metagenome]|uniref:Uncharacterized protein n=1 Tax=bioreactor metagenome TaxID=1076179 RepID=A0A645H1F4_9ZZZZ
MRGHESADRAGDDGRQTDAPDPHPKDRDKQQVHQHL